MKREVVLILMGSLLNLSASAQSLSMDDDRITWKISKVNNVVTGKSAATADQFKSTPDSIFWVRDEGKVTDRLHIDSKDQNWLDLREDGEVSFELLWKDIPGRITFKREHGEAAIYTEFIRDGVNVAPYQYLVAGVIKD